MLSAHGYVANTGPNGSRLGVRPPAIRQHVISQGFAWAASSYRCNGYVPGHRAPGHDGADRSLHEVQRRTRAAARVPHGRLDGRARHAARPSRVSDGVRGRIGDVSRRSRAVTIAGRQTLLVQRIYRIAGHCGFSVEEQSKSFDDLVKWVREGTKPPGDNVMGDLRNAGMTFTQPRREGGPGTLSVPAAQRTQP
jgi:hypothetical protein